MGVKVTDEVGEAVRLGVAVEVMVMNAVAEAVGVAGVTGVGFSVWIPGTVLVSDATGALGEMVGV